MEAAACFAARIACPLWLCTAQVVYRAKYGESAFLEVYQKLYEAPDPSAVLVKAAVGPDPTFAVPRKDPAASRS